MSVQLRAGTYTLVRAGTYSFTRDELRLIYKLYADEKLSLWKIKETHFNEAQIEQIEQNEFCLCSGDIWQPHQHNHMCKNSTHNPFVHTNPIFYP